MQGWLEATLEAITLAGSAEQVRQEVQELRQLGSQAQAVEDTGAEAKLSELKELLQKEGFFDRPEQRLLLFTEFRDTLDYLLARLKSWGFRVGCIHGSMKPGSRDEKGATFHSLQHERPARIDFYRARVVDGLGQVIHEQLFAVEISEGGEPRLQEPIRDPARLDWHEVMKVAHYYLSVDAMTRPMQVRKP